jgi:L-ascorbate metabolism protein UlaG (beta-lactamase superfamily)
MELRNLTNAFVDIKLNNGTRIFIDPWMTQGIYEGSWHHVDEVKLQSVDDVKYVFITHIHADHFDTKFIDSLPQTTKIYFPDIYPNRAVVGRKLPNRECIFVSVDETISVEEVFSFRFFSPMNGFGHLSEKFDDSEPNLAIDTGVAIFGDDARIIMLADNFPFKYNEEQISWMKKCDLLMFPYNAAADDYPICYDNLTALEKKSILYRRNFDRAARMDAFIKRVEPKLATPYSSDFLVAGPRAEEFIDLQPSMFLDREKCATFFSTMTGFPVVFLNKNDRIEFISGQSFIYHSESVDALNVHERAKTLLNKSNVKDLYADVDDPTLTSAFLQAGQD